jgi:hypothetical protein
VEGGEENGDMKTTGKKAKANGVGAKGNAGNGFTVDSWYVANELDLVTKKLSAISSTLMNNWPPDPDNLEGLLSVNDDLIDRLQEIANDAEQVAKQAASRT